MKSIISNILDFKVAALTVHGEARGEGIKGMIAVAWVIRNRAIKGGYWGDNFWDVCKFPYAFSCWNEGDPNREKLEKLGLHTPAFAKALEVVCKVVQGAVPDPTGGAHHYYRKGSPEPFWAHDKKPSATVGNHIFFTGIK